MTDSHIDQARELLASSFDRHQQRNNATRVRSGDPAFEAEVEAVVAALALSSPPVEQALPPNRIVEFANMFEGADPDLEVAISVSDLRVAAMAVNRTWTSELSRRAHASPPPVPDERLRKALLLACPLDGANVQLFHIEHPYVRLWLRCTKCGLTSPRRSTREALVAFWNSRATPALPEERAKIRHQACAGRGCINCGWTGQIEDQSRPIAPLPDESPWAFVDRQLAAEWPKGRAPGRAAREFSDTLRANQTAPLLGKLLEEMCGSSNRESLRQSQLLRALRILLHALHAHPCFGGPHLSLEDAIAEAVKLLPETMRAEGGSDVGQD